MHQPAGDRPDRAVHAAADPRRQRVGEGQRGDGADQDRRARRCSSRVGVTGWNSDNLSDFAPFGVGGHHLGGRDHLLLLHRAGRRLDRRRGGQEPAPEPAAGDHHRAGHGDHAVRRWSPSSPSPRSRSRHFEGQEAGPVGDPRGRDRLDAGPATVLAAGAVISIFSVTLVVDLRPDADPVRDGPRRHGAADLPQAEPAHADAGAGDDHRRRRRSRCSPALLPINFLAEMTSIGTLVAFLDRLDRRDGPAPHARPTCRAASRSRCYPVIPILVDRRLHLDHQDLRAVTIYVFFGWSAVALVWYFFYGRQPLRRWADEGRHDDARRLRARRARPGGPAPRRHARALGAATTSLLVRGRPGVVAAEPRARGRRVPGASRPHRRGGARRRRARGCRRTSRSRPLVHHARSTPAGPARGGRAARGEPDRRRLVRRPAARAR